MRARTPEDDELLRERWRRAGGFLLDMLVALGVSMSWSGVPWPRPRPWPWRTRDAEQMTGVDRR